MRRGLPMVLAFGLARAWLPGACEAGEFELVREGKAVARIVVAADAPKPEQFAAVQLQEHLVAMTGVRLPVLSETPSGPDPVVFVGAGAARLGGNGILAACQLDRIRDDGFGVTTLLSHNPPSLILAGKEPRGTLYAVYSVLDDWLSCGFFSDGDRVPRRQTVTLPSLSLLANPAFATRACYAATRFYAPKRFQATLWSAADWRPFLGWMAKRGMNCLVLEFSGATRAWGAAFDRAFPETRTLRRDTVSAGGGTSQAGDGTPIGWGLSPDYTTDLLKDALGYARKTLGLEVVYLFRVGEFEPSLKAAHPKLAWLAPAHPGVAGSSPALSASEPACRDLQTRLWKAVLETYGTDHRYLLDCQSQPPPEHPLRGPNPITLGLDILREIDPDAKPAISSLDHPYWGPPGQVTPGHWMKTLDDLKWAPSDKGKTAFLRQLPPTVHIAHLLPGFPFPPDLLLLSTDRFATHPYWYASLWGKAGDDLFEHTFVTLFNQFRQFRIAPEPKPDGVCDWNEIRGSNPLMDRLIAEFAWTGLDVWRSEGASDNRQVRAYLSRRYSPALARPMAEVLKLALQGAPRNDNGFNYRNYARWGDIRVPGLDSTRGAVARVLAIKPDAKASPFYETDVASLGRNYLHQCIRLCIADTVAVVREAKRAADANAYTAAARAERLAELAKIEAQLLRAHQTLIRLVATQKDLCLDDAILDAAKTPGAHPLLARAIREHQTGAFADGYALTDSIEYHQQVASRQLRFFLDAARRALDAPAANALPPWRDVFLHATREFIEAQPTPYESKAEHSLPSDLLAEFLQAAE